MGINVFPAPSAGGGIKSVQRGLAAAAGNVTITAVDMSKSFVTVFGTASSGTVAASGTINASNISGTVTRAMSVSNRWYAPQGSSAGGAANGGWCGANSNNNHGQYSITQNYSGNSTNLTGGSNNLVAAVVQGFLANSTTLTVSGACRWEVVEFN